MKISTFKIFGGKCTLRKIQQNFCPVVSLEKWEELSLRLIPKDYVVLNWGGCDIFRKEVGH